MLGCEARLAIPSHSALGFITAVKISPQAHQLLLCQENSMVLWEEYRLQNQLNLGPNPETTI